jgi:hypothetical protein
MNQLASKRNDGTFKKKMELFIHNIPNYSYIFEVTKMCGFSEFFTIYKDNTLDDLHKNLSLQLKSNCIKRLYMIHCTTLDKITVPVDERVTVRDFIVDNNCFRPFYETPTPSVYKIYLEYGTGSDIGNDESAMGDFDHAFNEFG